MSNFLRVPTQECHELGPESLCLVEHPSTAPTLSHQRSCNSALRAEFSAIGGHTANSAHSGQQITESIDFVTTETNFYSE